MVVMQLGTRMLLTSSGMVCNWLGSNVTLQLVNDPLRNPKEQSVHVIDGIEVGEISVIEDRILEASLTCYLFSLFLCFCLCNRSMYNYICIHIIFMYTCKYSSCSTYMRTYYVEALYVFLGAAIYIYIYIYIFIYIYVHNI